MAEKKIIELEVKTNTSDVESKFDSLQKQIDDTSKSVDSLSGKYGKNSKEVKKAEEELHNLNKAYHDLNKSVTNVNSTFEEVYGDLQPLTTRMGEAEDRLYELALAGNTTTKEYKELLEQVAKFRKTQIETDKVVDAAATTMTQKMSGALGGVTSGFAAYQGALGLIGVESEKVEEQLLKVQSAMAIAEGFQGLKDAKKSFIDLGSAIKTSVVTAFTTLRGAIIATGIGALVVTIGFLLPKIMEWIDGTKELERKQNDLNRQIDNANNLYKKNTEEIDRNINAELRLAKARGASEQDLLDIEKKGQKQRVEVQKKTVAELDKLLKDKRNMYIEAYVDEDWDRAKALNEEYKGLQAQRNAILKAKKDQNEDLKLQQEELNLTLAKTQQDAFKESQKTLREQEKEKLKAQLELQNELQNQSLQNRKRAENEMLDAIDLAAENNFNRTLSRQELEKRAVQDKYFFLIEQAKEYNLNTIELEKARDAELSEIKSNALVDEGTQLRAFYENMMKVGAENTEKEKKLAEEVRNKKIQMGQQAFGALADLSTLFADGNEEDQRKAFQINKAASLGNAIMNTAQGVTAAITQIPLYPGQQFIEAGLVGTLGGINIARIAATQFQGGGDSGGGGATATPTAPRTPSFDIIQAQPQMQLGALQQQPVKAYVVSGEVSTAQALDRNRVRNATF